MAMRSDGASMGREYLRLLRHVLERGARKDDRTKTGALRGCEFFGCRRGRDGC